MNSKFCGISLKCSSASICASMNVNDIDDDIVGTDFNVKAAYWIERTLEDDVKLTALMEDMIESWLLVDESTYLSFAVDGIGEIVISKKKSH